MSTALAETGRSSHWSSAGANAGHGSVVYGTWDPEPAAPVTGEPSYGWTCVEEGSRVSISYDAPPAQPVPRIFGGQDGAASEAPPVEAVPEACDIKGNVSFNTGERIYHVPGQAYYDETVINEDYGERWFCTEDEAVEAGWRKSLS